MKRWVLDNNCYQLMFELAYDEECILKFTIDKDDETCYWYYSTLLQVEHDCIFADNIEEAKEEFEYMIRSHFEDEISYWEMTLDNWDKED